MKAGAAPRTILYVAWAPFFSGAERALLLLLQHLDPHRFRPVVVLGTDGELRRQLAAAGVECRLVPVRYSSIRHAPAWARSVVGMVRAIRGSGAALVHSNDVPSFQPAGYAARLLGVPSLVHVRFHESSASFPWFLKPGFTEAIFISESLRAEGREQAPQLFGCRGRVIYDGVLLPAEPSVDDVRERRGELGLPIDRPAVLLSGQVARIKGLWEYIEAARILVAGGSDAVFAVIGEDLRHQGRVRREAEDRVRALGLGDRVRFYGFRHDAARLTAAFDVVAVPSHAEPLGLTALEAMALGRPVVASAVGGLAETIVHGETGTLVPARDADALASALGELLRNPALRTRMGKAGRARVEARFSIPRHAGEVQALYDELLRPR